MQGGKSFSSSSIVFENNYAMNAEVEEMPIKDLTVEMWAKTPALDPNALGHQDIADILTYATHIPGEESICETPIQFFSSWLSSAPPFRGP